VLQRHGAHVEEVNADYKGEQRAGSRIASFSLKTGKVLTATETVRYAPFVCSSATGS
jgi:hypothetical protein